MTLAALLQLACGGEPPLNVWLITMDTTRADHLGCYGNAAIQTPIIDALAKQGTRYEEAFTVVPITLPSHLSMMTGTYPVYHGVRENAGYYVPDELTTLAEVLNEQGYETGAVVGAFPLDSQTGIDQGFDSYDDHFSSNQKGSHPRLSAFYDERPASEVAMAARSWLNQHGLKPFFLWTHFFDPHQPWTPPSPFRERYPSSPYDAEIASVDAAIGQILAKIEAQGTAERTLIILTADHGEGLGEHGELTHALLLYSSTLRVPLIVRDPRESGGQVIQSPVATIDIFSTVLNRLGLAVPQQNQGERLPTTEAEGNPQREILSETLYGRMVFGWSPLKRLTTGSKVLIHGPTDRMYDRKPDPLELQDLATKQPEDLTQLRDRHAALEFQKKTGALNRVAASISNEDMERLASLGYAVSGLVGSETVSDRIDHDRLDPLESMDIFDMQNESMVLTEQGNPELAIPILERALERDPQNPLVVQTMANAHLVAGNLDKGLVYLELLLKIAPNQVATHVLLATYHRERGQLDEAIVLLKRALDLDPSDQATRLMLAYASEDAGRREEAELAYREMLFLDESHVKAANGLATLLYRDGNSTEAVNLFEKVLKIQPYYAPAYLNLAVLEFDRGQPNRAKQLANRALALRPNYKQARELLRRLEAQP